jgi:hypothetical protein
VPVVSSFVIIHGVTAVVKCFFIFPENFFCGLTSIALPSGWTKDVRRNYGGTIHLAGRVISATNTHHEGVGKIMPTPSNFIYTSSL